MSLNAVIVAGAVLAAGYLLTVHYARQIDPGQDAEPAPADPGPAAPIDTPTNDTPTLLDTLMNASVTKFNLWKPPAIYADRIAAAEVKYGIPTDMLARLLYQESHYREDIITGRVTSRTGAQGIAQFMPATAREMGVNPLDVSSSIDGAGRYLSALYRQTGSWTRALAAYNWGVGNVTRKGIDAAPTETRLYYSQILGDVNASNGTAWA